MANTPARYARTALGTSSATLATIPGSTTAIVTEIILTNTNATVASATITLAGVILLDQIQVPSDGIVSIGMKQVMSATEVIAGFASTTGVNVFISGVNVT